MVSGYSHEYSSILDTATSPVPEHFIWYFLKQMTEALIAFRDGKCDDPTQSSAFEQNSTRNNAETSTNSWEPLLRSDIKTKNVFCCDDNKAYPSYPRPVLADFDLSHEMTEGDRRRFNGTRGWQAPEKHSHFEDDFEYAPGDWPISEKSDIWAVGLVAYRLLYAGKGPEGKKVLDSHIGNSALNWDTVLAKDIVPDEDDGLVNRKQFGFEPPEIYSIGLVRLLERCLRYVPKFRPDLDDMKKIIDTNLERLDRLYGNEIKREHTDIANDHKVYFDAEAGAWSRFTIGQEYAPPRKRRKISEGTPLDKYQRLVDDWADVAQFPRPDLGTRALVVTALQASAAGQSSHQDVKGLYSDNPYMRSFGYLLSCLKSRITTDATMDIIGRFPARFSL